MTDNATHVRLPLPSAEEIKALPPDGGPDWNRLVFEKSPYLLQHAANPVDWFPWGEEAFARARELDRPVFLSVGYSTCHWCHVMEHESFEDPEIAALMNQAFVNIKVDREERPDIDQVYMTVTQAMTGHGGWPMTVIMTPDKKPFFAGTYFPKDNRHGRPGMRELIAHISSTWKDDRKKAVEAGDYISEQLGKITGSTPGGEVSPETLKTAFTMFQQLFEPQKGGFSRQPKFPVPHNLMFLLRHSAATENEEALAMVEKTLLEMRRGGIWDHVGYGFHRYSTDQEWLVPHFEKMLYDQALLAMAYTEAWQLTGKDEYQQTARETLTYVLRDMTSPGGGFYSAEDADSEGVEGKFYVWTEVEVKALLGEELGRVYAKVYNFEPKGNFTEESTGQRHGVNIPHLRRPFVMEARRLGVNEERLHAQLEEARNLLFHARERRIHPLKDDKILTDWNGLMIAAFAKAAKAFDDDEYRAAATRAADFVLSELRTENGRLLKRHRDGESGLPAHLNDYAFFVLGLLETYEATFDAKYLIAADELTRVMIDQFWDTNEGGFFQTATDAEKLIVRSKEIYDGAIPSGNSVAALALFKLARMTGNEQYEDHAARTLQAFSGAVEQSPANYAMFLCAAAFAQGPTWEIVLAGSQQELEFQEMARFARRRFIPNSVLVYRPEDDSAKIFRIAEILKGNIALDGKPTAYICHNFACEGPARSFAEFQARMKEAVPER